MRASGQTPQKDLGNPGEPGSGVPADDADVEMIQAPADPEDRQAFIQQLVTRVRADHYGEELDVVEEALSQAVAASGLPEQPHKWVGDTAAEIASGRHVVVDRHLAVASGEGADEVPVEADDPDA